MNTKYIVFSDSAVIFGPDLTHSDVANGRKVTSAGFCSVDTANHSIHCFGKSVSLGIGTDKSDARRLSYVFDPDHYHEWKLTVS